MQPCDRLLVRHAQSSEHSAFNLILHKYRHRLMKLSMRYTRNRADAEDAVQETFLRVYRGLMLAGLPPNRFVQRVKGDGVHYVYADPLGCVYVGSQQAYSQYKQHEQQQHLADEQQMTAQSYSDAAWNWGPRGRGAPNMGMDGKARGGERHDG